MGTIIGSSSFASTWRHILDPMSVNGAQPVTTQFGDHNSFYGSGGVFFKTIEGNGLIRRDPAFSLPQFSFDENDPPFDDYFIAGGYVEPYVEQLTGITVSTSTSSFVTIADAFTIGQVAGSGGTLPITSIQLFEPLP